MLNRSFLISIAFAFAACCFGFALFGVSVDFNRIDAGLFALAIGFFLGAVPA